MQKKYVIKSVDVALGVIMFVGLFSAITTNAQTIPKPQFLLTWKATNSFAPALYPDKVLPNQESDILASLEVISNGKLVDLSNKTIYWYENGVLLGGGVGAQSMTFHIFGEAPNSAVLKVELPDYPGGFLIHEITIPMVQPIVVIKSPYASNILPNTQANLEGIPYFFNATSSAALGFTWTVNGQLVTSALNPESLQISLPESTPAGYAIGVTLSVQEGNDAIMTANSSANLTYKSSL